MGLDTIWSFPRAWRILKSYGELFERLESHCLCTYLDDIIIFSATFQDHIENTPKVLRRLKEHGVKLKPRKCKLFERGYIPCAHCVGRGLKARSIQYQETVSEVRRLMGFLNYYR